MSKIPYVLNDFYVYHQILLLQMKFNVAQYTFLLHNSPGFCLLLFGIYYRYQLCKLQKHFFIIVQLINHINLGFIVSTLESENHQFNDGFLTY